MAKEKTRCDDKITFLIPSELKRKFIEKTESIQSTPSMILRAFIQELVSEDQAECSTQKS